MVSLPNPQTINVSLLMSFLVKDWHANIQIIQYLSLVLGLNVEIFLKRQMGPITHGCIV